MYKISARIRDSASTTEVDLPVEWLKVSDNQGLPELHFQCLSVTTDARANIERFETANSTLEVEATVLTDEGSVSISGQAKRMELFQNSNLPMVQCDGVNRFQIHKDGVEHSVFESAPGSPYPEMLVEIYWKNPGWQDRRIGVPLDAVRIAHPGPGQVKITCEVSVVPNEITEAFGVMKRQLDSERGFASEVFITTDKYHRLVYSSQELSIDQEVGPDGKSRLTLIGNFASNERWHTNGDLLEIKYDPYTTV